MFDAATPIEPLDLTTGHGRRLELHRLVETTPHQFNLCHWYSQLPSRSDAPACQTIGCLLGIASLHPPFQAQGLRPSDEWMHFRKLPVYQNKSCYAAASAFFDIAGTAALYLFGDNSYLSPTPSRETLLQHIDRIIETPQPPFETLMQWLDEELAPFDRERASSAMHTIQQEFLHEKQESLRR